MTIKEFASSALYHFDWVVLYYFIGISFFYTFLLIMSIPEVFSSYVMSKDEHLKRLFTSETAPGISLIAPAYNEEASIVDSVRSMLTMEYPSIEVVVINDGSKDGTIEILKKEFELREVPPVFRRVLKTKEIRALYRSKRYSHLIVVDKENGGKADALNAGLNVARTPLVCAMDADTLIEPDAILKMARAYVMKNNVVAVGGTIRIVNDCTVEQSRVVEVRPPKKLIPSYQIVEYLRAFLFGRLGFNKIGGNLVISGAFGLFHRESVLEAGGYADDTVGEDMELVVRLHRTMREKKRPYVVDFIPDPVAWTEAPEDYKTLGRQRERWHRGLADSLMRHRKMLLNPRYGMVGLVVFPYYFFVELIAPIIELLGYIAFIISLCFGLIDWFFAILFFMAAYGFGVVLSMFSIVLEEAFFQRYPKTSHIIYLIFISLIENLGYRQRTVFWRLKGLIKYIRGDKSWGKMERRGFKPQ